MRECKSNTNLAGALWLLQLWLSAIFEPHLRFKVLKEPYYQGIEGLRLCRLEHPQRTGANIDKMKHYFGLFHQLKDNRKLNLHPFIFRKVSPSWFIQPMITSNSKTQKENDLLWLYFLSTQFFSRACQVKVTWRSIIMPYTLFTNGLTLPNLFLLLCFLRSICSWIMLRFHLRITSLMLRKTMNLNRIFIIQLLCLLALSLLNLFQIGGILIIKASLYLWRHALIE